MNFNPEKPNSTQNFDWQQQPEADSLYRQLVDEFCDDCAPANQLERRMLHETGTRLIDWIDHLAVSKDTQVNRNTFEAQLVAVGYEFDAENEHGRWYTHQAGLFVPICVTTDSTRRMVVQVDAVAEFLASQNLNGIPIEGSRNGQMRRAKIATVENCELWVCERRGYMSWTVPFTSDALNAMATKHYEAFKLRLRDHADDQSGFELATGLIKSSIKDLGVDWTCDLFFATEREYWQRKNHAARVQKGRQDRLGLGWANHDHHTYRSSRAKFKSLIEWLDLLGFQCRERFYAGEEAGWGAQVLEQPGCGIVIFADVDLTPKELEGDFAHEGLTDASNELGVSTVGLWCQLYGEAFLQAGMHHLECTFDFDAAREQLKREGVNTMAPFTDCDYLRQAFTTGEIWYSIPSRTEEAVKKGFITSDQAKKFLTEGTVGSHLEILERNEGFKGFNQTGVSSIIRKTDPRTIEVSQ